MQIYCNLIKNGDLVMIFFVNLKTVLEHPLTAIVIVGIIVVCALIAYDKSVK